MKRLGSIAWSAGAVWIAAVLGCAFEGADSGDEAARTYSMRGVIRHVDGAASRLVIEHEAVPGYMGAMTMPFQSREPLIANQWRVGDRVRFSFNVTDRDSWIHGLVLEARAPAGADPEGAAPKAGAADAAGKGGEVASAHPLRAYSFTNELGQRMSLEALQGRAVAITFIFTRCPVPNYCPRLTRNFEEACGQLAAEAARGGPTNYHFLSVTIDPVYDTPEVLRRYAQTYGYDARHWSFLTGPLERIEALMKESGVSKGPDGNVFEHNFRTLIVGPDGGLRKVFPLGGNLSGEIAGAMREAMIGPERAP